MLTKKKILIPRKFINDLKAALSQEELFLRAVNQIVFLFGAQKSPTQNTARDTFFLYSQKYLPKYKFLLAEDFFKIYNNKQKDLLSIEEELAQFTDCVLIMLESPGTIAELGAFAMNNTLAEIILAVNKIEHRNEKSFINLGPLSKIEKMSKFGKVIYTDFDSILTASDLISNRLEMSLRKKAQRINLSAITDFNAKRNRKYKMLFLSDLISMFAPININEIYTLLFELYRSKYFNIEFEISLLKSLNMIIEHNGYYFKPMQNNFYFFKYSNLNTTNLRYSIINHYAKFHSQRLTFSRISNE